MRWLALSLLAVSLSTQAWTGSGNDRIAAARDYMRYMKEGGSGSGYNYEEIYWFQGAVAGLSTGFNNKHLLTSICYPQSATTGQIVELAANYLINHPEKREQRLYDLVYEAHTDAFGYQAFESCWRHEEWKAIQGYD